MVVSTPGHVRQMPRAEHIALIVGGIAAWRLKERATDAEIRRECTRALGDAMAAAIDVRATALTVVVPEDEASPATWSGVVPERDPDGLQVVVRVGASGRRAITDAVRTILKAIEDGRRGPHVDEDDIDAALQGPGDPDLVVRVGGRHNLSNQLLWESSYAELAFIESPWPAVTRTEFVEAFEAFRLRQRRFGGLTAEAR
jgi:hypothetical protein